MKQIKLVELILEIENIVIGERIKGGVFRPCQETIPSSTIEGAIWHHLRKNVSAVGFFKEDTYELAELTYSVRDRMLDTAKVPIFTSYLRPVACGHNNEKITAFVYIPYNSVEASLSHFENLTFYMGALKSKGYGKCFVKSINVREYPIKKGFLKVKIFCREVDDFAVTDLSGVYGFMFKPDDQHIGGKYEKSLFPGSFVEGPTILLKESSKSIYGGREEFFDAEI